MFVKTTGRSLIKGKGETPFYGDSGGLLVGNAREDPEAMIEGERKGVRGDPEREAKAWLERLASLDRKRSGYLDLAAEGIMGRAELRAKIAELEEGRETAEREIAALKGRSERLERMERDRDAVMDYYAGAVPGSLDDLGPRSATRSTRCSGWRC